MQPEEEPLSGGNMGAVHRRGPEVLRPAGAWTPRVHALLNRFADAGIDATPRPLGVTADGRERLSYLPGEVPGYPLPDWVWTEPVLLDAAQLLRRLHDASVPLAGEAEGWRSPVREPAEVVCHNDFAPYNLVFAAGRPVGVIDWDYCSPGPRIWDLAYLAYRLAPLTGALETGPFTAAERSRRLRLLLAGYGLDASPAELVTVVVCRLRDLADFSDAAAVRLGNPELAEHAIGYRADAERLAGWTPSPGFEPALSGGDPRSLTGVPDALARLRDDPAELPGLVDACSASDPVVRMRAADALEKYARERPDGVAAVVERLFDELAGRDQPSIQWHLAQILGEVPLTPAQHQRAASWLCRVLDDATDWIVLNCSLDALAALARQDDSLRSALCERAQRHVSGPLRSVAKRASRLLAEFG